jgi:hypothetical protein
MPHNYPGQLCRFNAAWSSPFTDFIDLTAIY